MASTYFDDQWLAMKACKEWLLLDDDTSAECKVFPVPQKKIELSNMMKEQFKVVLKAKNFVID